MRLTNIDILSSSNALIANLSFRDPGNLTSYAAKDIVGLDSPEIIPRFYGVSQTTAAKYYAATVPGREIILRVGLNPNFGASETYSSLRDALYKAIAASRTGMVKLWFKDGANVIAQLTGFVIKFENVHFSKIPEVKITIKFDDGVLRSVSPLVVPVAGFGVDATITDNASTAPHGMEFGVTFSTYSASFTIHDTVTTDWVYQIVYDFQIGDHLVFSSKTDKKTLYITRGANVIKLADKVQANAVWPILFPGVNSFHIDANAFTWDYLNHYLSYWGV